MQVAPGILIALLALQPVRRKTGVTIPIAGR